MLRKTAKIPIVHHLTRSIQSPLGEETSRNVPRYVTQLHSNENKQAVFRFDFVWKCMLFIDVYYHIDQWATELSHARNTNHLLPNYRPSFDRSKKIVEETETTSASSIIKTLNSRRHRSARWASSNCQRVPRKQYPSIPYSFDRIDEPRNNRSPPKVMNAIRNLAQTCARQGLAIPLSSAPATTGMIQGQQHYAQHCLPFQTRFISKYISKSAKKRIPLTTKRAGKGYYKGKGGTKEGRLTSKGRFIVDPKKRLELVVPDLEGFNVSDTSDMNQNTSLSLLLHYQNINVHLTSIFSHQFFFFYTIVYSLLLLSLLRSTKNQLKPYIARTASKVAPELRRRPGQV